MPDGFFLLSFFYIGEADFPAVNRNIQRYFLQASVGEFLGNKLFDDTAHTQTDPGKFNEKLHGRRFDGVVHRQMVGGHVIVNILPGHIVLIQKHQRALFKKIPPAVDVFGIQFQMAQIGGRGHKNILNRSEGMKIHISDGSRMAIRPISIFPESSISSV